MNKQDTRLREQLLQEIADLQRRAAELATSEERYRSVVTAMNGGVIMYLRSGEIAACNPAAEQILGLTQAQIKAGAWTSPNWRSIHADGTPFPDEMYPMRITLRTGQPQRNVVLGLNKPEGNLIWLSINSEPLFQPGENAPYAVVTTFTDITERKQAEADLRESEARFRAVLVNKAIVVFDQDRELRYTHIYNPNPNFTAEYVVGKSDADLFLPADAVQLMDIKRPVLATGVGEQQEVQTTLGGQTFYYDLIVEPKLDPAGQIMGLACAAMDITARKQAEESLRASEARFRALVESTNDNIYTLDQEQRHTGVYGRWLEKFNLSPEFFLGRTARDLFGVEAAAAHETANARALAGENVTYEWPLVQPEGTVYFQTSLSPLYHQQEIVGVVGIGRNITDLKQAEESLRASEEKFRQIIEKSGDGIMLADETGQVVEWNPAMEQITGLTRAEVRGRGIWEVRFDMQPAEQRTPANYEAIEARLRPYFQTGQSAWLNRMLDYEIQHPDGSYRNLQTANFPIKTEAGFCVGSVVRDITEHKQTERIEAAQLAVSQVLAKSPEPGVALRQVLEAMAAQMDWPLAELWWPNPDHSHLVRQDLWSLPDLPELAKFIQTGSTLAFAPGEGLVGTVWQTGQAIWDRSLLLLLNAPTAQTVGLHSATAVPIIEDEATVGVMTFCSRSARPLEERLLAVLTDLGRQIGQFLARKQLEAELAEERASLARRVEERTAELSRANAELSQALQTKDEFLAAMSHELRTPLNIILGKAEVLQEGTYGPLNERQLRSATVIEQSGRHLLALITDILDFAQAGAGKLELNLQPVSVMEVSQASLAFFSEAAAKKNLTLSFHVDDWGVSVQADPQRLKQILVNLLDNAVKFTPAGGQVSLTVKTDPVQKMIHFVVQDSGIGIKAEDIPRLFKPFTQLDARLSRKYEGTGLGLALVRQLVELHGGTVGVESEGVPGQGSCFTISLPWRIAH